MANIKIYLEPNESPEEAEALLLKALTANAEGGTHGEEFLQPVAREVLNTMQEAHTKLWAKMLKEISKVLDDDVNGSI